MQKRLGWKWDTDWRVKCTETRKPGARSRAETDLGPLLVHFTLRRRLFRHRDRDGIRQERIRRRTTSRHFSQRLIDRGRSRRQRTAVCDVFDGLDHAARFGAVQAVPICRAEHEDGTGAKTKQIGVSMSHSVANQETFRRPYLITQAIQPGQSKQT